ncbi:Asp-tRNA(Asn)/Glu-tRNA(Gln) amidotransferase subunit GatC [bacterium]|nr:MAG: Asp-tRNA(Asn)/Glu-tRNA(Gln) amidotransferase subunit GatC [bacterium]
MRFWPGNPVDFLNKECYDKKKLNIKGAAMAITKDTVEYVAHLARIELQPKELDKLSAQLKQILGFIDTLKKIEALEIPPIANLSQDTNVKRADKSKHSLSTDKALENSPIKEGKFFVVPKIIE